jgi:hypothetical protein
MLTSVMTLRTLAVRTSRYRAQPSDAVVPSSDALKRATSGASGLVIPVLHRQPHRGVRLHVGSNIYWTQVLGWCMVLHSCQGLVLHTWCGYPCRQVCGSMSRHATSMGNWPDMTANTAHVSARKDSRKEPANPGCHARLANSGNTGPQQQQGGSCDGVTLL